MTRTALALALAAALAVSGAGVSLAAQEIGPAGQQVAPAPIPLSPEQEELAAEIESELKCPVCRSQSVRTSRSFMAEDMSRQVRRMVAEGKSKEEIREYFVARYGDYIILAPRKEGFAWTVWLLPFALVLGGAATIFALTRRWKSRPPPAAPAAPRAQSAWRQRLERELKETE
ncbi:MAG TPA: cytochrome c-type biogenesis protein [Gemmatimonadota bacterium]|nr:cytochrome c-type biogenesis protein [Gemmatimonadota bacterium]